MTRRTNIDHARLLLTASALLLGAQILSGFDPFRTSLTEVEEGNAQLGAGKPKDALKYYDEAIAKRPNDPGVHYNRALALSKLGKLEDARKALLQATAATDRALKAKSFYNLGNVLHDLKRYDKAGEAYQRALRLDPRHGAAKWNLELALRRAEKKKKEDEKKNRDNDKQNDKQNDKKQSKQKKPNEQQDGQQNKQSPSKQQQEKDPQNKQNEQSKPRSPDQSDPAKQAPQPSPEREDKQQTPSQRRRNQVLDALDRNDRSLQRKRARMLRHGYRRPVKDW